MATPREKAFRTINEEGFHCNKKGANTSFTNRNSAGPEGSFALTFHLV